MKKALTLIELIFTMLIIAFAFTAIPRITYVSNKTLKFSKKEDAIFNMISKTMDVVIKEYDENNTDYDDILLTGHNNILECNTSTNYRIGGFKGSRNCENDVNDSLIKLDSDDDVPDDVDDYNNSDYSNETVEYGHTEYDINITVGYTKEWNVSNYNDDSLEFNFTKDSNGTFSNIKRIEVKVYHNNQLISSLKYYSANIGHALIGSVLW